MNKHLARAKTFVSENRTSLAAVAGLAVGVITISVYVNKKTLIEITQGTVDNMRDNRFGLLYETPFGDVLLIAVPN